MLAESYVKGAMVLATNSTLCTVLVKIVTEQDTSNMKLAYITGIFVFVALSILYFKTINIDYLLVCGIVWYLLLLGASHVFTDRWEEGFIGPAFGGSSYCRKKRFWEL